MPEELDYLGSYYGLRPDQTICRHLQRSPLAIELAARYKLQTTRKNNFYTARELCTILGVHSSRTLMTWVDAGWLKARRSPLGAGKNYIWCFLDEDIEKFLHEKPWLFDVREMPRHYFRFIIREEYDRDPWYTCVEAAALLGVKPITVKKYIRRDWMPTPKRQTGPWRSTRIRIRRSTIEYFLAHDPRSPQEEKSLILDIRRRLSLAPAVA